MAYTIMNHLVSRFERPKACGTSQPPKQSFRHINYSECVSNFIQKDRVYVDMTKDEMYS